MKPTKANEKAYARALKKIAKQAAHIVDVHADGAVIASPVSMMRELEKYATMIEPWANKTAAKMIEATRKSVERSIKDQSREISRLLRQQINTTPMGVATRAMQSAQVELIKSIPIEAGVRAQNLALSAFTGGRRPSEVAAEIERTEQVTTSRAMLIARTETAKAASIVTEVRAKEVGATHYIWRTAGDSDVRESHAEMEGEVCAYDDPPIVDGEPLNPGMIYNCFVGSTKVSLDSNVRKLIRSGYSGKVVNLFAGNVSFAATPNHPILTMRGWVPAGAIQCGDYVVQVVRKGKLINQNKKHNVTTFDDAFASLALRGKTKAPQSSFNFYGDIPNGDVDVVPVNLGLPSNCMAKVFESISDFSFPVTYRWIVNRIIGGGFFHVAKSFFSGFCNKLDSVINRHLAHSDVIGLATIAPADVVFSQDSSNSATAATVGQGQGKLAFSFKIFLDYLRFWKFQLIACNSFADNIDTDSLEALAQKVWIASDSKGGIFKHGSTEYQFLRVSNSFLTDFSGHVYTLETVNGWYSVTPESIVSKNCRCYAEVILPD